MLMSVERILATLRGWAVGTPTPLGEPAEQVCERDPVPLGGEACAHRDLKWLAGETADSFVPDDLVEAQRKAARGRRHSAFAVWRAHLVDERREVLVARGGHPEPLIHRVHPGGGLISSNCDARRCMRAATRSASRAFSSSRPDSVRDTPSSCSSSSAIDSSRVSLMTPRYRAATTSRGSRRPRTRARRVRPRRRRSRSARSAASS